LGMCIYTVWTMGSLPLFTTDCTVTKTYSG